MLEESEKIDALRVHECARLLLLEGIPDTPYPGAGLYTPVPDPSAASSQGRPQRNQRERAGGREWRIDQVLLWRAS